MMVFFLLYSVMSLCVLMFEPHLMAESSGRGLVHAPGLTALFIACEWKEGLPPLPLPRVGCSLPLCVWVCCVCVCACAEVTFLMWTWTCSTPASCDAHMQRVHSNWGMQTSSPRRCSIFFSPLFFKIYSLFVLPSTNQTRPERQCAATGSIWLM